MTATPRRRRGAGLRERGSAFLRDQRGAVMVVLVMALPVVFGSVSATIEYGRLLQRRAQLQAAADAAALAGGNMLKLVNADDAAVRSAALQVFAAQAQTPSDRASTSTASVTEKRGGVEIVAEETVPSVMGKLLSLPSMTVSVQSRSQVVGMLRLCALALETAAKGALSLEKAAQVTALDCSIYSNSRHAQGILAGDTAVARAQSICSAGGYQGAGANLMPAPITQCAPLPDPLKDQVLPTAGTCIVLPSYISPKSLLEGKNEIKDVTATLNPGTYCSGLKIGGMSRITLNPGIYIMKDGPLVVEQKASLSGSEVGFFFTGDRGGLRFDRDTTVSLAARSAAPMAGLLMAEERTVSNPVVPPLDQPVPPAPPPPSGTKPLREYRIVSDNTRTMLGTIYLPAGRLVIDAKKPVADQSAYTVIVAQMINLYEGPNLTLNTNYGATTVPVPDGVGPKVGAVSLAR
ncbi:pilus assembly protein TadG-related protein [Methylobacterium sp.]|uniref:TadE/TadG family type IV pilus assembly protein n=1 Tax=Methylobacterium sp. TaxID=409 RepID=UPI002583FFD5|nr:pilus assembly protein TadG-related protein [Methylobacterium sp.]